MRTINRTLSAPAFLDDLNLFVKDGFSLSMLSREEIRKHKVARITELMTNLPDWQFYLVGELDPEAYAEIRSQDKFSERVKEIRIRDVVNAALITPSRLTDMVVRHAPTIVHGKSQFGS